ncbi:MAG: hypothetical protein OEQ18_08715 [Gammaproteobacteria bacterium]|nr:hypothetical protein [Gammaproteobacteria bacterium]
MLNRLLLSLSVGLPSFAAYGAPHTVFEPLVLLNDHRQVTACGSVIHTGSESGTRLRMRLLIERNARGPLTVMTVEFTSLEPGSESRIRSAVLHLRGTETPPRLHPASQPGSTSFRAQAHQRGDEQGALLRGLLLAGGQLDVVLDNDARYRFEITGPAPSNVFRHYLACTGDLYGPRRN